MSAAKSAGRGGVMTMIARHATGHEWGQGRHPASRRLRTRQRLPDKEVHLHVIETMSQPAVLITEQEVAFGTAASVPLPRTKPTRRLTAAVRAMFLSSSEDARPAPRHYPPRRDAFLEDAATAREMRRL